MTIARRDASIARPTSVEPPLAYWLRTAATIALAVAQRRQERGAA